MDFYEEGIATCDICGRSDDHKHDSSEYDVDGNLKGRNHE